MEKTILIYEAMDELSLDSFGNPLISHLCSKNPIPSHLHIDSFSDLNSYIDRLDTNGLKLLLVLLVDQSQNAPGIGKILNLAMETRSSIIQLGRHELVSKLTDLEVIEAESYNELNQAVDDWLLN